MNAGCAQMRRVHHGAQCRFDGALWIGEKIGDAGERLVLFGIEHVQDRPDQKRMAGLFPMVALVERAFGIDQNVGDILHVADFLVAAPHLQQRIIGG
jgi:hypothetical protein